MVPSMEYLFAEGNFKLEEETSTSINPDEFLNLNEFEDDDRKPPSCIQTVQQLTPPISPHPIWDFSPLVHQKTNYQEIHMIPVAASACIEPTEARKVKNIVPKPSSSSDSDTNVYAKSVQQPIDKALVKQQRIIRNRQSAILSRNKKKEYVQRLETQNDELRRENSLLKAEISQLKAHVKAYSVLTGRFTSSFKKIPSNAKNATLMLAVIFMVGFNIIPFSNFAFKSPQRSSIELKPFISRHLLVLENSSRTDNETSPDSSSSETLTYYNQTDHIRKVNIENIRRWIPEPDLYNTTYVKKDFKFNTDPLQEKLAKMYEKSHEQFKQKSQKSKKRPSKRRKPLIGPMQIYDSNMNIIKLNEFFDEIDRKDDTFYVFSFKADHLLLPAVDKPYNFSQIKLNLIMPRNNGKKCLSRFT
jgi:bZIP transcription factor